MTQVSHHGPIISLWLPLAVIRKSVIVRGTTRLQKLVFLASIEGHIGDYLGFTEYKYGPWSMVLQNMVQNFTNWGYLKCDEEVMPGPYSPRQNYSLTNEGVEFLKELEDGFDFLEILKSKLDILEKYADVETTSLRNYVYTTYLPHKNEDGSTYDERLRYVESEAQSYLDVWTSFQDEHYPVSYFVLAVLEHVQKLLQSLDEYKSSLKSNIVLTSCEFLVRTSWRLLNTLETTSESNPQECHDVKILRGEIDDIVSFTDLEASKVLDILAFHDTTLSDLTLVNDS